MAQLGTTIINGNLLVTGTVTIEGSIDASIDEAVKAQQDLAGRVFSSSYGNTITIENSVLSLKAPDGQTLSTVLISTADTLQAISENGATTNRALEITNATQATSTITGALKVAGGIGVAGYIHASRVYGAWWNDYAELRDIKQLTNKEIPDGGVVAENGDETLSLTTERLQAGAKIISDTFGMCIGNATEDSKPIALCGRVLAKPYESRDRFRAHIGDPVCAAPGGCVSFMTQEEIREHPDRIIGQVVSVPDYEFWGRNNIPVNGRIWISVK